MKRWIAPALLAATLAAGCARDMKSRLDNDPEFRGEIHAAHRAHPELAAAMMDNLLASDTSRAVVFERLMAQGDARQQLMLQIARDRTMMDGVVHLAVQDSATRFHLLTLVRGITIGRELP